jgi:hypothetical protein
MLTATTGGSCGTRTETMPVIARRVLFTVDATAPRQGTSSRGYRDRTFAHFV